MEKWGMSQKGKNSITLFEAKGASGGTQRGSDYILFWSWAILQPVESSEFIFLTLGDVYVCINVCLHFNLSAAVSYGVLVLWLAILC